MSRRELTIEELARDAAEDYDFAVFQRPFDHWLDIYWRTATSGNARGQHLKPYRTVFLEEAKRLRDTRYR